jgi:ABC-type transport system substrate-binding protein
MAWRWFVMGAAAVLLAACGRDGGEGRAALTVAVVQPNDTPINPIRTYARLERGSIQSGLLSFDRSGQVAGAAARSWAVSPDGLQYVFRLRKTARWSDGATLTADDAAKALDRLIDPDERGHSPLAPMFDAVEAVASPAPEVVEIRLSRPYPPLLALVAHPAMTIDNGKRAVTGPFLRVMEADPARAVRLRANPAWFAAKTQKLSRVTLQPMNTDAAIAAFRSGKADIVTGAALGGLVAAQQAGGRAGLLHVEPALGYVEIEFGADAGALQDPRLRQAMSMAIDRPTIAQSLFAVPAIGAQLSLIPQRRSMGQGAVPPWTAALPDARLAEAQGLAAAAGATPSQPLTLTMEVPDSTEFTAIVQALAQSWEPLGIIVRARLRSEPMHEAFVAKRRFQLAIVERISPVPAPDWFLDALRCTRIEAWRCSPEADAALDRAAATGDLAQRALAERLLLERVPVIPLISTARWHLVSQAVDGWADNEQGAHPLSQLSVSGRR